MKRRRQLFTLLAASALLLVVTSVGLAIAYKYEPAFYRRAAISSGTGRQEQAQAFLGRCSEFINDVNNGQLWSLVVTQEQLNAYLQDEPSNSAGLFTFPEGVSEPRVDFEADRLRVGFRYGSDWSSTVVSIDLKVWLVAKEPNVIALELCGLSVGGIPLGSHALMEYVTEAAREQATDVTWYRTGSHPVALLRLQANQNRPTLQLRCFEFQAGKLMLHGKPTGDIVTAPEPAAGS